MRGRAEAVGLTVGVAVGEIECRRDGGECGGSESMRIGQCLRSTYE
jgi:hypothetical protein